MGVALVLVAAGVGYVLWASGAFEGLIPSRRIDTGLLMNPPTPPAPTGPTSGTSIGPAGGLVAGVAAGVGALIYAIVDKGLFRGGEEGVKVNPARDAFFAQFVDYARGDGAQIDYSWQQPSLVYCMGKFTTLDGNQQNALITALYRADTMDSYVAACRRIADAFRPSGFPVEIPT